MRKQTSIPRTEYARLARLHQMEYTRTGHGMVEQALEREWKKMSPAQRRAEPLLMKHHLEELIGPLKEQGHKCPRCGKPVAGFTVAMGGDPRAEVMTLRCANGHDWRKP